MQWTKELLLEQLNRSPKSTAAALVCLWEREISDTPDVGFHRTDTDILSSFAEQVIWRKREIERGDRAVNCALLSDRQLEIARLKLPKYWAQLLQVANERHPEKAAKAASLYGLAKSDTSPCCSRCGQEAQCRYNDIPFCGYCLRDYERERTQESYELNREERTRLQEELRLLKSPPVPERQETEALVIEGTRIRFKSAKEFAAQYSNNRHGMPRELATACSGPDRKHNLHMPSRAGLEDDDPFACIGMGEEIG